MHPGIQPILNTVLETLPGLENQDKHTSLCEFILACIEMSMALTKEEFHRGFLSPLFQFNNTQSG